MALTALSEQQLAGKNGTAKLKSPVSEVALIINNGYLTGYDVGDNFLLYNRLKWSITHQGGKDLPGNADNSTISGTIGERVCKNLSLDILVSILTSKGLDRDDLTLSWLENEPVSATAVSIPKMEILGLSRLVKNESSEVANLCADFGVDFKDIIDALVKFNLDDTPEQDLVKTDGDYLVLSAAYSKSPQQVSVERILKAGNGVKISEVLSAIANCVEQGAILFESGGVEIHRRVPQPENENAIIEPVEIDFRKLENNTHNNKTDRERDTKMGTDSDSMDVLRQLQDVLGNVKRRIRELESLEKKIDSEKEQIERDISALRDRQETLESEKQEAHKEKTELTSRMRGLSY